VVVDVATARSALVFLVAAVAELQRPPFDMPIADAEIVFGPYTEYTGLRFAFFLLAEYGGIVVMSLLFSTLYLGGWRGPFDDLAGWAWTLLKGFVIALLLIWIRVSVATAARGPAAALRLADPDPVGPAPTCHHRSRRRADGWGRREGGTGPGRPRRRDQRARLVAVSEHKGVGPGAAQGVGDDRADDDAAYEHAGISRRPSRPPPRAAAA
jgi:hypothetical protein